MIRQLVNWVRRDKLEAACDRELRYHLESRMSDLQASGMPAEEARRQTVLELGGIAHLQEEGSARRLADSLDPKFRLCFSLRSLYKNPAFSVTAVLSLALGVGTTTAIYSLVDQVLRHALPVRAPERLVLIDWKGDQVAPDFGSWNLSPIQFAAISMGTSSSSTAFFRGCPERR